MNEAIGISASLFTIMNKINADYAAALPPLPDLSRVGESRPEPGASLLSGDDIPSSKARDSEAGQQPRNLSGSSVPPAQNSTYARSMPFTAWDEAKQQEVEVVCELVDIEPPETETRSTPGSKGSVSIGDVWTLDGVSFALSDADHDRASEKAWKWIFDNQVSWTGGGKE